MKSSVRSKLFLLVYGIILAFIAGLILLNNSFLENYYINNREKALITAFSEVKEIDLTSDDTIYQLQEIENEYNLNIQILEQIDTFDTDYIWNDFEDIPMVFSRVYGNRFSIPNGILGKIIYDYSFGYLGLEDNYAQEVSVFEGDYQAYVMDIQSEFNLNDENTNMIGLWVAHDTTEGDTLFYVLTITFQSIHDSIKIFNSFTIIVGFFFMVLSFIAMYFISYSFTNPILQINKIAQEIAGLDFSNRVSINTDDEFEDLGKSINTMSSQLEENIKELQKTNDRLAKEILEKTDIDKMRREFIASASHELKTPLSLIMGYTEALRLPDISNDQKDEYLSIILDETEKMNNLVKELLKLSQIESGKQELQLKTFSLHDFLKDTLNLFHLVFEENQINYELQTIKTDIESDYSQLQMVLTNYINNAIHHVKDPKKIIVSCEYLHKDIIRVSVFNTGENIPDTELKRIWDSFYKVDKARTRSYGGQGLGLSICRTILDMLGYRYGVINKEEGIEFYFDIVLEQS